MTEEVPERRTDNLRTWMGSGDALYPGQWYNPDTYYQILEVKFPDEDEKREGQNIYTSVRAKQRGTGNDTSEPKGFDEFELDDKTVEKLKDYPRKGDPYKLSSYLPSLGVRFAEGFIKALQDPVSEKIEPTEQGNFYQPIRSVLYSRKISQLIAKTWWAYLEARKTGLWDKFTAGEWNNIDSDILDGLVAREIFLFAGGSPPNDPTPDGIDVYDPLQGISNPGEGARFLILPTSKSWQGISLSLLLAGQAYRKLKDGKYHQISQPILSTGEIVFKYGLETNWGSFHGDIKELIISQERPWIAYQVVLPYPKMPADADQDELRKWADAEDDDGELPFYRKEEDIYLIDVTNFRPPYPYIPLSCT